MLTVIFGAGATYDSDPQRPPTAGRLTTERPPLAAHLFSPDPDFREALQEFSRFVGVVQRLRRASSGNDGSSLESELATLTAEDYPERPKQLLAIRFYLHRIISVRAQRWGTSFAFASNYAELVDRLGSWAHQTQSRVNYMTFNYDTLLDRALRDAGIRLASFDGYVRHPRVTYFKLHGSTDWFERVVVPASAGQNLAQRGGGWLPPHIDPSVVIEHAAELGHPGIVEMFPGIQAPYQALETPIPMMALPAAGKTEFVCPSLHIPFMQDTLSRTTTFVVIGWRGSDEHFVEELRRHVDKAASVWIANGSVNDSEATAEALGPVGFTGKVRPLETGFTTFLEGPHLPRSLGEAASALSESAPDGPQPN